MTTRRVAFVDSGVGLVGHADALHALRPDLGLVLSLDPDNMPYGPRTPDEVRRLILASARAALPHRPDAIVVACNTASVHGLEALRAELEPGIPVIGTVPAIRPAALAGGPLAVWATAATTSSAYLRGLVDAFAQDTETYAVAALGLAEAIESGARRGRRRGHRGRRPAHAGPRAGSRPRLHPLRARGRPDRRGPAAGRGGRCRRTRHGLRLTRCRRPPDAAPSRARPGPGRGPDGSGRAGPAQRPTRGAARAAAAPTPPERGCSTPPARHTIAP